MTYVIWNMEMEKAVGYTPRAAIGDDRIHH